MARELALDVDAAAIAGRGQSWQARDAFWLAANLAVADAIRMRDQGRLARLHEAQAEVLRAEGKPFLHLLSESFKADLAMIDTELVAIIANDCRTCARDHGSIVPTLSERQHQRLPHVDCENGRCACVYTRGWHR